MRGERFDRAHFPRNTGAPGGGGRGGNQTVSNGYPHIVALTDEDGATAYAIRLRPLADAWISSARQRWIFRRHETVFEFFTAIYLMP